MLNRKKNRYAAYRFFFLEDNGKITVKTGESLVFSMIKQYNELNKNTMGEIGE